MWKARSFYVSRLSFSFSLCNCSYQSAHILAFVFCICSPTLQYYYIYVYLRIAWTSPRLSLALVKSISYWCNSRFIESVQSKRISRTLTLSYLKLCKKHSRSTKPQVRCLKKLGKEPANFLSIEQVETAQRIYRNYSIQKTQ